MVFLNLIEILIERNVGVKISLIILRPLTTIERSYTQTFPQDFEFEIENQSKTDFEQMIGNAVPVKLGEYVANAIIEYIESKATPLFRPKQLVLDLNNN
ncbi:type II DNA modification methyltransferase [Calothrix parasitica NIES-267]|uniref:Type II DNA modification methyltransferase n=1 Tax=Calothrix parasitica NIES-267 TaxID=1973488 RepID=A0A1Z4LSJ0_9CYAN|nr:type II DNA modification methyltransferase [Calothrix parasitica NIES-267]